MVSTLIWKCIGVCHMGTLGYTRINLAPGMGPYFLHLFG